MMIDECGMKAEDRGSRIEDSNSSVHGSRYPASILHFPSAAFLRSALCILTFAFLSACVPMQQQPAPTPPPPSLVAADQALSSNLPDIAIADAQSYLRGNPHGAEAAHAYYSQGLGWEEKVASDPAQLDQDWFQAGSCFVLALQQGPSPALEGDIRAELSNVQFYQDRFADAIDSATRALSLVSSSQVKSVLLFRIGWCQQRLGRFSDADQTFRKVQRMYPNSPVAISARDHEGQKNFYVQLASYDNPQQADNAVASLQGIGEVISRRTNPQGVTIIDDGPYPTYTDAKAVKQRMLKNFPLALIVP
jgi:tetratricopeptide (TPR) repeat protein